MLASVGVLLLMHMTEMFTTQYPGIHNSRTHRQTPHDGIGRAYASHRAAIAFSIPELRAHVAFGFCYWP